MEIFSFGISESTHYSPDVAKRPYPSERQIVYRILRQTREDEGLVQEDLATALDLYQSDISKYESGKRPLELPILWRLCRALGITLDELVATYEKVLREEGLPKVKVPPRKHRTRSKKPG